MFPGAWLGTAANLLPRACAYFYSADRVVRRLSIGPCHCLARQLLSSVSSQKCSGDQRYASVPALTHSPLGARESFTVIREASNLTLPLSGVVGNPQARANYLTTREVIASPLDKVTPLESVEAEISRLTWAVIDGIATPADRDRLAELVNEQHAYRRA
jgi:hypothetical protein